jgi:putative endonuclease
VCALLAAGYQVLERNVRFKFGEIDAVCRDGGALVFVEIKSRRSHHAGLPHEHVTAAKRRRLAALASAYLQRAALADVDCRFDVVSVRFDPGGEPARVEVIADAFRL